MIFLHQPANPFDSVDPDYELRTDAYEWTLISIQDTRSYGGGYVVNQYGPGPTADDIEWSKAVGETRTLKAAKELALKTYAERHQ